MAKKMIAFTLVLLCTVSMVWGYSYIKKSGMLEPFPEPQYLTDAESETREFYQQLDQEERALYTAMYRGVSEFEQNIALPYEIDGELYTKLYCLLEKQESELFYIDSTYYTAMKIRNAKIIWREDDADRRNEMTQELEKKAEEILAKAPENADDFETALFIHDYIIANCKYEIDNKGYNATVYGCLVEGEAHCEGYAKAFDYLATKVGLECITITGITDKGENHAWNQIKIAGEWYNVDVTWDDADNERHGTHLYFLCPDETFGVTHMADDMCFEALECHDTEYNYFKVRDLYIDDEYDAERILAREAQRKTDYFELKFSDVDMYEEFVAGYLESERVFEIVEENRDIAPNEKITLQMKEYKNQLCILIDMP